MLSTIVKFSAPYFLYNLGIFIIYKYVSNYYRYSDVILL